MTMADCESKRAKRITRGKMRFVEKSKWELPIPGSKSYWNKICEGIESKVIKVRNPSTIRSVLYPDVPFLIRSSASSASTNDTNDHDYTEPIFEIHSSPPPTRNSTVDNFTELPNPTKLQSNREIESTERGKSLTTHWRITKLSKMTKLVNDFLSSTRNRVRPSSAKTSSLPSRKNLPVRKRGSKLKRDESFEDRSKDVASDESSIGAIMLRKSKTKMANPIEDHLEKRSVIFRDDIAETIDKCFPTKNVVDVKPTRPRAPSLSIASAVPSFGRVVISIESTSSIEDDVNNEKTPNKFERTSIINSNDPSKLTQLQTIINNQTATQDFLKVPKSITIASNRYPTYDHSIIDQKNLTQSFSKMEAPLESLLRRKTGFWPKRSMVHVFRALKAMKRGTLSKANIDLERNRFFAAPLDVYSPSPRSSISSDDETDFVDGRSGPNDEYDEPRESEENVDVESEWSYASVRERLMRNAVTHVEKDFQRYSINRIVDNNAFDATSVSGVSSNFYETRSSLGDRTNDRNEKKLNAIRFVSVPRIYEMYSRKKADKCLACMCQSFEQINQTERQHGDGGFSNVDANNAVSFDDAISNVFEYRCSNGESFYRSLGTTSIDGDSVEKIVGDDRSENEESGTVKTGLSPTSAPQSSVGSLTKSSSQLDVSRQSRGLGKIVSKNLVNEKSVISALSVASERSRSISDPDDSDQGVIDPNDNDTGMGQNVNSKFIAACHMPVNLKPSREALKALRHKKSRSIRSRVTSAEKSAGSSSENAEDSDDDGNNDKSGGNGAKIKSKPGEGGINFVGAIIEKQNVEAVASRSNDGSEGIRDTFETVSREIGIVDDEKSKTLRKGFHDDAIITDREVNEIAIECLNEGKTVAEILKILAKIHFERSSKLFRRDDRSSNFSEVRNNEKIASNLLTLLADSKSYLNRENFSKDFTDLTFTSKQKSLCDSRKLRRVLPLKSYNLVAPILGMAKWYPKRRTISVLASSKVDTRHKESRDKTFDLIVHPPSRMAQRVSFEEDWDDARPKLSPYALFLKKPRRKAVTWRPLTERDLEGYDPEATLKMRAAKITDEICEDFCQWLESLAAGTNQTSGMDVNVLKDMFETDFTAEVCRTMQMSIKEMPMVPDAVAASRNCPGATALALTRRHLVRDARAEIRPKRTVGFGTALPNHLKFLPPRNGVYEKWLQCENVPTDLETMDAVWKDITHLTSVKGFVDWLKAHPRVSRPKALEKALVSKESVVTRHSEGTDGFKDLELDLDQIRSLKVGDNDPDTF